MKLEHSFQEVNTYPSPWSAALLVLVTVCALMALTPAWAQAAAISGTVFQSDGTTPVTDATLSVDVYSGDPCGTNAWVRDQWIYPENNGAYEISGLPAGSDYFVRVRAADGNYIEELWADPASVRTCDAAAVFALDEGETKTGVNFQLDPGGVIKGTVFKTDGQTPVNDATLYVEVYSGDPCGENVWVNWQWINPGENGVYEISGLPAGSNYFVKVVVYEGNYIAEWWADPASVRTCGAAGVFTLNAGETKEGVNFQLDPGSVIKGTVFKSDGTTPVTDATLYVDVYSGDPCGGYAQVGQKWIYPENNGAYEISGLPAGSDYFVRVRVADGNYIEEWWADPASVRTCDAAGVFALDAGATKEGVNFQLDPGAVIKGTVFKSDGETPVTDATLYVDVYSGDPCGENEGVGQQWIYPGNNGAYEISGLPGGANYFVRVHVYEGNYIPEWWASSASVRTCDAAEVFALDAGATKEGVNFQLDPGAVIKGTIFQTDGETRVTDPTLIVTLYSGDPCGTNTWVGQRNITPDDNGAYEMSGLPAGSNYFLKASVYEGNYIPEYWASSASVRTCDAAGMIVLNNGEIKEGVNFQLDPGGVIKGTVFQSDGQTPVNDATLYVTVYSGDPCGENEWVGQQWIYPDENGVYEISRIPAGTSYFVRVEVYEGNYFAEWWADPASVRTCDAAGVFPLTDGENKTGVNFQLDQGGVIKGTVFKTDGQTPVNDATLYVQVYSGDPCGNNAWVRNQWIYPGGNGAYEIGGLPAGSDYFVRVRVADGNYIEEWWAPSASVRTCGAAGVFVLNAGETKEGVNFQLDQGGVVKGTVFKSDGTTPVTDATLYVTVYSGNPCETYEWVGQRWIYPDDNGVYEIGGLPTGSNYFVKIEVYEGNYIAEWWADPASVRTCAAAGVFTLDEGATKTGVNFQLDPGAVIKGTVFQSDGKTPVTDATLYVTVYSGDPGGSWQSVRNQYIYPDDNGAYEISGLPTGSNYFVKIEVEEGNYIEEWWADPASVRTLDAAGVFTLSDGETKEGVNFQLDQGGVVKGTIFKTDGVTPVSDASFYVDIYSGDPCGTNNWVNSTYVSSTDNGTYEIQGIPTGSNYFVKVDVFDNNYLDEWWADPASVDTCGAAGVFDLNEGATRTEVNFQLGPGGVVKGTVFKTDGVTPVTDATLIVDVYAGDPCGESDYVRQRQITPGDNGAYEIGGLPTGSDYFVRVRAYEGNYIGEWWAPSASVRTCGEADVFTLSAGETKEGVNFQVEPGGVIKGTVFKTDGVTPVTDGFMDVELYSGDPCGVHEWVANANVNSSGAYEITTIPGGTNYFLTTWIYQGNYQKEWWASPASVNVCNAAGVIALTDGEIKTGLNFKLDPGAVITGTVFKDDGVTPLADMWVMLRSTTKDQCVDGLDWQSLRIAQTAADGTYRLEGITPGNSYYLTAVDFWMGDYAEEWWTLSQSTTACYQAEAIAIPAVQEYPGFNFQLDVYEPDWDGDGIATVIEDRTDVCTDSRDADTDDDGIADGDEDANHNGLVDPGETDPCEADTDGDGIQDGTEFGVTSSVADPDGDGPSKGTDVAVFVPDADPSTTTDPGNADTDGDGLKDGEEDANFNGKVDDGETDPEQKDGKDSSPIYFPVQTPDGKTSIIFIE